jgi:hypothetical protein
MMNKPHKHAEYIKAWADGATIEYRMEDPHKWIAVDKPSWREYNQYRIKPQPVITKKYTYCDRIEQTLAEKCNLDYMTPQTWYNSDEEMTGKHLEWVFVDNKLTAVNIIGED